MNTQRTKMHSVGKKERLAGKSILQKAKMLAQNEIRGKRLAVKQGFTLIELLVVIGIISILAGVVLVAVNPARQFKMARDSQRVSNVNTILNAIGQNIAEHKGKFVCGGVITDIPTVLTDIRAKNADDVGDTYPGDIYSCIIPDYISSLPADPSYPDAHFTDPTDYDTAYNFIADAGGRITVSAHPELATSISVSR